MALFPIIVVPFIITAGLIVNTNTIPDYLKWIEYASLFKYGF